MPPPASRRTRVGAAVVGLTLVAGAVAITERRLLISSFSRLGHLDWRWLALAVLVQLVSMVALARLQRRLLVASGHLLTVRFVTAVAYASNAISSTVPLLGRELGVAYTFRRYRRAGAESAAVVWSLGVAGVISAVTLVAIVALSAIVSGRVAATIAGLVGTIVLASLTTAVLVVARRPGGARSLTACAETVLGWSKRLVRRPAGDIGPLVAATAARLGTFRIARANWSWLFGASVVNWLADAACLACAIRAVGAPIPWPLLVTVWATASAASTLSPTPGGLGVAEFTLAAALLVAGLRASDALSAALAYRLVSFWFALAAGWTSYLVERIGLLASRSTVRSGLVAADLDGARDGELDERAAQREVAPPAGIAAPPFALIECGTRR